MSRILNRKGRLGRDKDTDEDPNDSAGYESDSDTASDSTLRDKSSSETDSHHLDEGNPGKKTRSTRRDPGRAAASGEPDAVFKVDGKRRSSRIKEEAGCVKHLKDLLIRLSPMISMAGTSDNTAEMLMFLSDTDPNFHTLQLVKAMRQGARNALEPSVDQLVHQYLETVGDKIRQENPVVAVLNNLFQNETFISYMEHFQNTLLNSSDYLHQYFEGEMTSVIHEFYLNSSKNGEYIQDYSSNASSLNSSLNQSGFLFLSSVQYERIANTLTNKQLIADWTECLNQLLSVTPGEPVLQQSWFDIKKGLKNCLLAPIAMEHPEQNEILDKSLKMHSKLLASQTQQAITEANLNLIEAASEFWLSKKLSSFITSKSNMKLVQCSPVLRIVKLLLFFQADLSLLWIRYPQHLTMLLIERWLDFLVGISARGGGHLSSCDMVSILDPEATWLKHWLHPRYGRAMVLAAVTRSPALISDALKVCLNFINSDSSLANKETHRREFSGLSEKELESIKFVYSVSTILEFVRYEEGRQLFPISISTEDEPITVSSFLTTILTFKGRTNMEKLSNCVRRKLKEICASSEQVVRLLCKVGIVELFVGELKARRHIMDRDSLSILLGTLQVILCTAKGLRYISQGNVEKSIHLTPNELCNDLLNLFGRLLVEEHQMSANYALVFEMSTTLLKCEVGRFLYAGHQTFRQTLTNLTSLYHRNLLGVLEAVANGSIVVEHRQSLLRQTAAAALAKARQEPSSQPWAPPATWREREQSTEEHDHVSTLPAHVIAILISTPHGVAALRSVVEEDPALLWLQHPHLQLPLALLALASHTAGVEMILEQGVRHLAGALFSWQKLDEREAGLELVAAAGGVLDSRLLLQDKLGYREELSRQLTEEYSEGPVLDESYVLRAHLLQRAAHLGTEHVQLYVLPPHRNTMVEEAQPQEGIVAPGGTRRNLLQQSGLWHFLQNTRMSVHDHTWLRHCRRHYQAALIASDNIKNSQVFSMLEWALEALGSEDLPHSPEETQSQHASPSPESSPRPQEVAQLKEALAQNVAYPVSQNGSVADAAVELARRYCSQLEMVTAGRWSAEKLHRLIAEMRHMTASEHRSTDWLTIILYILSDANFERAKSALARLSASPPGRALWPLHGSSKLVVKLTKLLLSQYQPATFSALQTYSSGCIWNLVQGWLEGCWLGLMSWAEVCNWTAAVVLLGPDYAVYITVAVLKHRLRQLYRTLNQLPTPTDKLVFLQTEGLESWRLKEHLAEVTEMCRVHRTSLMDPATEELRGV